MNPTVSVILNIHREARYVLRTLRSLDEAASFARQEGIHCELIVVLDRSDDLTRNVTKSAMCYGFDAVRFVEADHGSLGPARNTGIAAAVGKFIWTADADDLVSYNCIAAMHAIAEATPGSVVFPEYLVAFGEYYGINKYFDDSVVDTADFIFGHPYISRVFLHRDVFHDLQYADLRLSSGFAFEDWHLNCEFKARGLRFLVAPQTVFYYRQRKGSLLKEANSISTRQIPDTRLHNPEVLLHHVALENERRAADPQWRLTDKAKNRQINYKQEFLADPVCMELTYAAIRIDPSMNLRSIEDGEPWQSLFPDHHWGHDYAKLCTRIGTDTFSDIVLLPWLNAGGGERFILDVLKSLASETKNFRCLVISGGPTHSHEWIGRLPSGSLFLDVFNDIPGLDDNARDQLVLRLVLAVAAKTARLHLKGSYFAHRWFSRFSPCLGSLTPIYYRFCDKSIWKNGSRLTLGSDFLFISEEYDRLNRLITDNQRVINDDVHILGGSAEKWQCVYAVVSTHESDKTIGTAPVHKILWASRLCDQQRPDLLPKIAGEAHKLMPALRICAFGSADLESGWAALFAETPGLQYLGPFQNFNSLQPEGYDGLLYTSSFDGLPNVVLEAMGWGLPVIAPDVGGISEAVRDGETGFLIPDHGDDDQLIAAYVAAIQRLYQDWAHTRAMAEAGRTLIAHRHNRTVHRERIRQLFDKGTKA